eukprot:398485_1
MSTWRCKNCDLINYSSKTKCIACFAMNQEKFWQCNRCFLGNKRNIIKCIACFNIRTPSEWIESCLYNIDKQTKIDITTTLFKKYSKDDIFIGIQDASSRLCWQENSSCLLHSTSNGWMNATINKIIFSNTNENKNEEWLSVNYNNKCKYFQRFCFDIKPIDTQYNNNVKKVIEFIKDTINSNSKNKQLIQLTKIQQIDAALNRYYNTLHKEYDGLFLNYCEENGLDNEIVADEFPTSPQDNILVDFDTSFPFKKQPKNVSNGIYNILRKCRNIPDISFEYIIQIDQDHFDEINPTYYQEIGYLYYQQCPKMLSLSTKDCFIPILAVGRVYNFDFLLHLVDDFTRHRIRDMNKTHSKYYYNEWDSYRNRYKHFQRLKDVIIKVPNKYHKKQSYSFKTVPYNKLAIDVLKTWSSKCFQKFECKPTMKIND